MSPSTRKRCRRFDIPGDPHHLTFSCFHRLPLLTRPRSCRWMLDALDRGRRRGLYDLWAYVIMPEHIHVVLRPARGIAIASILTALKQPVARHALEWLRREAPAFVTHLEERPSGDGWCHRFWQRGGGYDRNVRSVSDVHAKIAYIHANPVRRGLAARPEDWPWSSCRTWVTGTDDPIPLDRASLPVLQEGSTTWHGG